MGTGCSSNSSRNRERSPSRPSERLRTHRLGNFTFQVYETKKSGIGCKRTPAWETNATHEEVQRKRFEFWDTRVEGDPRAWQVLRAAVEEPDPSILYIAQSKLLVEASGLRLMGDSLMVIHDESGRRYEIPPFILSEPERYGSEKQAPALPTNYKEKSLSFKIRCTKFADYSITTGTLITIKFIKEKYATSQNIDSQKVRLFYNGKELKNDMKLAQCNIEQDVIIQAAISP